jgi:hypothetical protein
MAEQITLRYPNISDSLIRLFFSNDPIATAEQELFNWNRILEGSNIKQTNYTFEVEDYNPDNNTGRIVGYTNSTRTILNEVTVTAKKPKEVVKQRKIKEQLKKESVEQSELTSTDIDGINNAVTEDSKPTGLQRLGSLILKQSQKLSKFVIPLAFNLIKEYGIDKLEAALEEESDSIDELREQLKEEFCNVQLPQIIAKRNNAVDYLNNTGRILDTLTISVNFGASFAEILETLIKILRGASFTINQASKTIPLIPGAVVSAVNDLTTIADTITFKPDGTPNIPPLKITAAQVSPAFATVQSTIVRCVDLLDRLDILITLCDPNANLTGISDSINTVYDNELIAASTENDGTYKGFILEIESTPFTDTVNKNRAVGKNRSGIILISTESSFASNPQVLIDELKFIIDRDDLKSY